MSTDLGRLHQQRGELAKAEPHYLRALALNPNHVLAHNNLGLLYHHQGRDAEARRLLETARRLDPQCRPARANLELRGREPAPTPGSEPRPAEPPASVPADLLVRLSEDALVRAPANLAIRCKYAELCVARRLPRAAPQVRVLLELAPEDPTGRRLQVELSTAGAPRP